MKASIQTTAAQRSIRTIAGLVALVGCVASLTGCGALDTAAQAKEGSDAASYLSLVQPQLQGYGETLQTIDTTGTVSPAKAGAFTEAQGDMEQLATDLEGMEPSEKYRTAHGMLIKHANSTAAVLGDLAAASRDNDQDAYAAARTELVAGMAEFGEAMEAITKPFVDAASK